jgi:hypothetical protein
MQESVVSRELDSTRRSPRLPRRCKSKDELTLTLPILNPNAKP